MIIITVTSIILIALVAYAANRILSFKTFKICPLCAGVSGTWLWMLAVSALGYWPLEEYQLMLAAMMGGSVVGIAYQIEKRMPESFGMFHKLTQVVFGFIGVYFLIQLRWLEAAIFIILAAVPAAIAWSALGYWPLEEYQLMLAAMMGGSVVGIAYQIEKRMPESFGMFHKLTQVVLGFIGVYFLVQLRWLEAAIFIILAAVPAVIAWLNREKPHRDGSKVAALEKEMNKCC